MGDASAAVRGLERAISIYDTQPQVPTGAHRRVRFALARALVASGGDRARAITLAEQAREGAERPEDGTLRAEIDAWLSEQQQAAR
jgi:hypothetical protein